MPKRKASKTHVWVYAVIIRGDARGAADAYRRGTHRVEHDTKVEVLDIYCNQCKLYYGQIGHQVNCDAADENDNLIGGPTGQRKKRDHSKHNCAAYGCNPDIEALRRAVGMPDLRPSRVIDPEEPDADT